VRWRERPTDDSRPPGAGILATLAAVTVTFSCGGLPALQALPEEAVRRARDGCREAFPAGAWSVLHSLEVSLPLGGRSVVMGASAGDSTSGEVRSVLVSPEGLVVFDAQSKAGRLVIHRALPPLDHLGVAPELFRDVRLVLFAPRARSVQVGRGDQGMVCRFIEDTETTDVLLQPVGGYRIVRYDARGRVSREIRAHAPIRSGFASRMELSAPGVAGYRIDFQLLRVEQRPGGR
jgi:hypothetical protein